MYVSAEAVRAGLWGGAALSVPLWLFLNACTLSTVVGFPKSAAVTLLAATLAVGLALAPGAVAAWRIRAASLRDGVSAGMAAGLCAAVPVLVLVVPAAATTALGVFPLVSGAEAAAATLNEETLRALTRSTAMEAAWAAPLLAIGVGSWLALLGAISGAASYAVGTLSRRAPRVELAPASAAA